MWIFDCTKVGTTTPSLIKDQLHLIGKANATFLGQQQIPVGLLAPRSPPGLHPAAPEGPAVLDLVMGLKRTLVANILRESRALRY